ncbi:MAG: arginase family protein [Methylobacterium sp.]|jgi:hypothetical protein|nr:arginase family protein [Methylobacterium sp.]
MTRAVRPLTEAPDFHPIASLLGAPIVDIEHVMPGDLCLVGLFEDHSDSLHFGARFAARQIRYASLGESSICQPAGQARVLDLGDLNVFPLERERNLAALIRQVTAIAERGAVPIIVGGAFDMGNVMQGVAERSTGCEVARIRLPNLASDTTTLDQQSAVVLTVDVALCTPFSFAEKRPLARLRQAIEGLNAQCIKAVHLTGLAPELDLCGRHESALGDHVLRLIVAHLRRAGA